jgi:hypothetical protein
VTEPTRDLLFCAAALLDQGRTVDRLSRPLTAAALIGILAYPAIMGRPPWVPALFTMMVALSGLAEAYFAFRVGFDAALFHQLASAPEAPDFAGTDAALTRLGLLPAAKLSRPAEARVAGAKRLFGFQILALVAQVLSVLVGACIALAGL